ncbi:MAG: SDR family NAD(P)-dependent oxidoreductase, partial [Paracoccaceae bacterium]
MRLDGKTAIVTGGGSGFGAGIARKFIAEGAQVVIADINSAAAETLSDELGAAAFAAHVDVADLGSVKALARQAEKDVGAVDIIINNAGVTHLPTPLDEVSEEDFDRVFSVN